MCGVLPVLISFKHSDVYVIFITKLKFILNFIQQSYFFCILQFLSSITSFNYVMYFYLCRMKQSDDRQAYCTVCMGLVREVVGYFSIIPFYMLLSVHMVLMGFDNFTYIHTMHLA